MISNRFLIAIILRVEPISFSVCKNKEWSIELNSITKNLSLMSVFLLETSKNKTLKIRKENSTKENRSPVWEVFKIEILVPRLRKNSLQCLSVILAIEIELKVRREMFFAEEIEKLFSSEFFGETFDSKETEMRRRRLVNANYPFISTWFEILMKRSWLEQENSSSKLSDRILFNEIICVNYRFDERVQDASDLFFQLTEEIPRTGTNFLPKGKHQKSKS